MRDSICEVAEKMATTRMFPSCSQAILRWLSESAHDTTAGEDDGSSALVLVLVFVLVLSIALLLFTLCLRTLSSISHKRSPPGPVGLPLVGSLPFLDPELHTYFSGLARKYGPVLKIMLGCTPGIVITSPSAAREVLKDHDIIFANRDVPAAARVVMYGGKDIAWSSYGPEWRMLRKVCMLKLLSNTTLDSIYCLRRREVRDMVHYLYEQTGSPLNVGEQIFLTILNVVTSMMWGGIVEGEERAALGAEFRKLISDMVDLIGKPNVSDFFPALARFDLQGIVKQIKPLSQRMDNMLETMIQKRLKMEKNGDADGGEGGGKDFVQFLLKLKDQKDAKTPLTMDHIKATLLDLVIGGTDTSSNTIEFAMAEVINKPQVLAKVQQELDAVVGEGNIVEESHIACLPYLCAVMKESLRLHPVAPLLIPHSPSEDAVVGGYNICKGSRVFVNIWAIHRDPTLWENPDEFIPERFWGANGTWDYSGNSFTYLPFGSGRRICVGIAMGERMVLYSLATLFHSFDWKLPEGKKMDLSEQFGILLKKKVPLIAVPTPRLSDPMLYE